MTRQYASGAEYMNYLIEAAVQRSERAFERFGQSVFNILYYEHPRVADMIRATPFDPFHHDEVSDEMMYEIAKLYEDMILKEEHE